MIKSNSFKYKSSITGKASNSNQENGKNTEQEHLTLTWSKKLF